VVAPSRHRAAAAARRAERGYVYVRDYVDATARRQLLDWLTTLHPLWEQRYSTLRPPPPGKQQRPLLRPVYWLGNWQFACLGYYEPPKIHDRCVTAEPFPPVLATMVSDIEARIRRGFAPADVPAAWRLNTCLVNFYGSRRDGERWTDVARVGEHRDVEPGPVASISIGERALFQFLPRGRVPARAPARTQWLDDGSLQAFGGPRWKDELLHRVQRVEDRGDLDLPPRIDGFRTRRVNLTFRFVPDRDVVPFHRLAPAAREDVRGYVEELARHSPHFARALRSAGEASTAR
jgi:alkylated DNA repair dioxygenase AlkB